ncbi:hypothetical protein [Pseudomonas oryzihabitans]|uniref:hypothetical protein n=1 Tax=Pseudomonas oryzihabitans TaxID=47885 RepID=UPI00241F1FFF|nr:hypothetical protein [Pseudomonas oryzihabitans]
MAAKWKTKNKKLNPAFILNRYEKVITVLPDGKISYGLEKFELDTLLFTMIDFGGLYRTHNAQDFMSSALEACAIEKDFSKDFFIKSLNVEVRKHLSVPEIEYVLSSSVSISKSLPIQNIEINGARVVSCGGDFPEEFRTREVFYPHWDFKDPPFSEDHCAVLVFVRNKHWADAFEQALDALDLVRGIFCLHFNPDSQISFSGRMGAQAENKLALGGMHCLHNADGSLAVVNNYWFERGYVKTKAFATSDKNMEAAVEKFKYISGCLAKHKDGVLLRQSILRYVRALDNSDKNSTVLQLWTTLENLAGRNDAGADGIVERCSFIMGDREYHRQALEHLRQYRNENMHAGVSLERPDWHCLQLQRYFRYLIYFYLSDMENFPQIDDANRFLDLSDKKEKLLKEIDIRNKALDFLNLN